MGSTHSRICRCDDRHSMRSIAGVQLVDESEQTHKVNVGAVPLGSIPGLVRAHPRFV